MTTTAATIVHVRPDDITEHLFERTPDELRFRANALIAHRADLQRGVNELLEQYKVVSNLFEQCSETRAQLGQIAVAAREDPRAWCDAIVSETGERLASLSIDADECRAKLRSLRSSTNPPRQQRIDRIARLIGNAPSTRTDRLPIRTDYAELIDEQEF